MRYLTKKSLTKWVIIGSAIAGSISSWVVGMVSGGLGVDIGSHIALLLGGAIFGGGVGAIIFLFFRSTIIIAIAGEFQAIFLLVTSLVGSIWGAIIFWKHSGGVFLLTVVGAGFGFVFIGFLLRAPIIYPYFTVPISDRLRNLKSPYPQHESTFYYLLDIYQDGLAGGIFGALLGIAFANVLYDGYQGSLILTLLGGWILGSLLGTALADFVIKKIRISPKRIHLALGGFIGGFVAYLIIALFSVYFYS